MMRTGRNRVRLGIALCAAIGLAGSGPARATEKSSDPATRRASSRSDTWYAKSVARGERGSLLIVNYWSKGDRFRAETVVGGHTIITLVNGPFYYTIDSVAGTGVKLHRSQKAIEDDESRERPFANELRQVLSEGGERIGERELGGAKYDVYRVTNDEGKRQVWVSKGEETLPIQVETYSRRTTMTEVLNYAGWMSGMPISDSLFEPDPRLEIEEIRYEDYVARSRKAPVGPAPVLYKHLLHGLEN